MNVTDTTYTKIIKKVSFPRKRESRLTRAWTCIRCGMTAKTKSMTKERFKLIPAVFVLLRRENEVLMLLRQNTGWADGQYSLVAGHADGNESMTAAIIREAREEAGIELRPEDLHMVHVMHLKSNDERANFFFEADKWEGEIENKEPHKCAELSWFPMSKLPENTIPYVCEAMRCCGLGIPYSEYGWSEDPLKI